MAWNTRYNQTKVGQAWSHFIYFVVITIIYISGFFKVTHGLNHDFWATLFLIPSTFLFLSVLDFYLTNKFSSIISFTNRRYRLFRLLLWVIVLYGRLTNDLIVCGVDVLIPTSVNEWVMIAIWLFPIPYFVNSLVEIITNRKKA